MKDIDKLISALYLAKSDNREAMLSDLILTVLYGAGEQLDTDKVMEFINDFFHLKPINYEIVQCLESLVDNQKIIRSGIKFSLTDNSKSHVHNNLIKGRDSSNRRFAEFNNIVNDLTNEVIEESEKQTIWDTFNEYLLECFMTFGRKAVDIFLPYKEDKLPQDNSILESTFKKLKSEKLIKVFNKLVLEYPDRLTELELRHLNTLASRAERFYSLGIESDEYEKFTNFQIRNLVVFADTNILYSILNLHAHQERAAIKEIIRLANEKVIDFKLVYLPKTYKELQKAKQPLENAITRERLTDKQIMAMLKSGKLDELATAYYERKLLNSDFPHPADNIRYASDILARHGLSLYNHKFPKLEDDTGYLNKEIRKYYEFQQFYNKSNEERKTGFRLNKDDFKIEHDVFLREVIKTLKEKFSKEVIKFLCLTIDRSLIHFDHYNLRSENQIINGVTNPNFMLPSVFMKKIRPFLPIVTRNYRKAFIASLTAPSLIREDDNARHKSILTQKSITYFKNLGIDDEEVICSIIKRELFLEEFSQHEQGNTAESFIKSEISKEIEKVKLAHLSLEKHVAKQKSTADDILERQKQEIQKVKEEKVITEMQRQSEIDELVSTIKEKQTLELRLRKLNEEQEKFSKEKSIEIKNELLEEVKHSIITIEKTLIPLKEIIEKRSKNYKWRMSVIPVIYFILIGFLVFELTWEKMAPYTYLLSLLGLTCSYIYLAISGESFSPLRHFELKKIKISEHVYTTFNFDNDYLERQRARKEKLETEIETLSNNIAEVNGPSPIEQPPNMPITPPTTSHIYPP
jgi:hypothetical protein